MSQTICRMYDAPATAKSAKAALEAEYYSDLHMVLAGEAGKSIDDIVAAITKGNVLTSDARVYAQGISKGGSLVIVHAPFGSAAKAMQILAGFGPIDSGIPEPVRSALLWDDVTPMSSILQMPVLMTEPAPFSSFWNLPILSGSSFSISSAFGVPLLSQGGTKSSSMGMPLLSDNPTPLSSLLRIPTLSKGS